MSDKTALHKILIGKSELRECGQLLAPLHHFKCINFWEVNIFMLLPASAAIDSLPMFMCLYFSAF